MAVIIMKCPKCGTDVANPTKTWKMEPKGRKPITVGLFKCSCGKSFRAAAK
jgi:hypothetical protein